MNLHPVIKTASLLRPNFCLALAALICGNGVFAQDEAELKLVDRAAYESIPTSFDDEDDEFPSLESIGLEMPFSSLNGPPRVARSIASSDTLADPDCKKTDLTEFLPPVGEQGPRNTCVAWALGYAAYSCQIAQERHSEEKPDEPCEIFSPKYIFSELEHSTGIDTLKAIQYVTEKGCASRATMATASKPTAEALAEGETLSAIRYARAFNRAAVKRFLDQGYPVIMIVFLDSGFRDKSKSDTPYKWSGVQNEGLHAITAVAYDDCKRAIKIMNSWGTHWKDNGYCWVDYDTIDAITDRSWCAEAYVVQVMRAAPLNIRTASTRYKLRADHKVYPRGSSSPVTLTGWHADAAACTSTSLYVLLKDDTLHKLNDDQTWTKLNTGLLTGKRVGMISADRGLPLHVLTRDGIVLAFDENSGRWTQVILPGTAQGKPVDLRERDDELHVITDAGKVFIRRSDSTWQSAT